MARFAIILCLTCSNAAGEFTKSPLIQGAAMCNAHREYRRAAEDKLLGDKALSAGRFLSANRYYDRSIKFIGVSIVSVPGAVTLDDTSMMLVVADGQFRRRKYQQAAKIKQVVVEGRMESYQLSHNCR